MLEGFATQLVDKYVAPYANVDPEQLRVGVRDGKVVLRDVRLKPEAFDSLGLPLTIREGVIGELEVDISWKSLRAKPVQIRIKDVSVIVGLTNEEQLPQRKAEQMLKEKFEQLLEDEEVRRMRVHGQATASLPEQSFAIRLFAACVGPIHASIENVHLRYEDATSIAERPFAAGIRLDRFSLVSTNDTW
ncbi:N-terminal region of Chorein, a TM vesicle-mediated sorter-domain-containing protein, partial [Baffinella frigidus]